MLVPSLPPLSSPPPDARDLAPQALAGTPARRLCFLSHRPQPTPGSDTPVEPRPGWRRLTTLYIDTGRGAKVTPPLEISIGATQDTDVVSLGLLCGAVKIGPMGAAFEAEPSLEPCARQVGG